MGLPVTASYDVLVVGLGPVGATLATLLGRRGLSVLAIERAEEVYPLPRAAHIDHEVMRIFQSLGLVEAIHPHVREAPDYEFRSSTGETLIRIQRAGVMGASGWATSYNVFQPGIEIELRRALAATPSVTINFGAEFEAISANDPFGVTARVRAAGTTADIRCRYLVGCDGSWSPVRESLGIQLDDYAFDEPWLVIDTRTNDERGFPAPNLQICDPQRPTTFVHMGPGRLRWEFMLRPDENPQEMLLPASLRSLLGSWAQMGPLEVERSAVYRFHGLVAQQWRQKNVFLAGDAAHQMPPFMGQGMCSGLRDAANLAWKLACAIRSAPAEPLLESYQAEREPHVRFVIEKAIEMGRVVCTSDVEVAARRDAEMLASPNIGPPTPFPPLRCGWLVASPGAGEIFPQPPAADPDETRLDDLLGGDAWLVVREGGAPPRAPGLHALSLDDVPNRLAAFLRDWLDLHGGPAVLVRPDRYVFGTGDPEILAAAYLGHSIVGISKPYLPFGSTPPPLSEC